jgi:hypothetical protein
MAQLLFLSQETWEMEHPNATQAIHQLGSDPDDPWLRAITVFALGEIGAALSPRIDQELPESAEAKEVEQPEEDQPRARTGRKEGRKARRSPPADLLGILINDDAETETKAEAEDRPPERAGKREGREARRSPPADLLGALIDDDAEAETKAEGRTPARADKKEGRKARRTPPADLLGVISEVLEDSEPSEPSSQPQEGASGSEAEGPVLRAVEGPVLSEAEGPEGTDQPPPSAPVQIGLTLSEIEVMVEASLADPVDEVRLAAQAAERVMAIGPGGQAGLRPTDATTEEGILLSTIEKIIFLKEVPFFQGMTIDQLKILANVCEEEFFEEDTRIFNEGDPGGALYVVVNGRVGIEQEKRKGSFVRLATLESHSYFGEVTLFDNSPRTAAAIAVQDTLTLRLRREPLIALARQHPDLSLELINVLSSRLREANTRISELARSRPRQLQKLFDQFD